MVVEINDVNEGSNVQGEIRGEPVNLVSPATQRRVRIIIHGNHGFTNLKLEAFTYFSNCTLRSHAWSIGSSLPAISTIMHARTIEGCTKYRWPHLC